MVVTDGGGFPLLNNLLDGFGFLGSTDHTLVKVCTQLTQRTGESTQQQHPRMNKGLFTFTDPDSDSDPDSESNSCSWQFGLESESSSMLCEKFCITRSYVNSENLNCSYFQSLLFFFSFLEALK